MSSEYRERKLPLVGRVGVAHAVVLDDRDAASPLDDPGAPDVLGRSTRPTLALAAVRAQLFERARRPHREERLGVAVRGVEVERDGRVGCVCGEEAQDRGAGDEGQVDGEDEPGRGGLGVGGLEDAARGPDVAVLVRVVLDELDSLRAHTLMSARRPQAPERVERAEDALRVARVGRAGRRER